MFSGTLLHKLILTTLLVLLGMVLWGAVGIRTLFEAVILLVLVRGGCLVQQWMRQDPQEQEFTDMAARLAESMLPTANGAEQSMSLNRVLASPEYQRALEQRHSRARIRDRRDLAAEILCLVVVVPASVILVLMLTSHILSFDGLARWAVVGGVATAAGLHFLPNLIPFTNVRGRLQLRGVFATGVLLSTLALAESRHPYLLKFGSERRQLEASCVLEQGPTVEAGRHADLVFAHAADLEIDGRLEASVAMYERGLALSPHDTSAHRHAEEIYARLGRPSDSARHHSMAEFSTGAVRSFRVQKEQVRPLPHLPSSPPSGFLICLVPFGNVSDSMLDWAGREIEARSGIPVCRFSKVFELPAPDRRNGLLGSMQWKPESLFRRFAAEGGPFLRGPIQYLIVSSGDIFIKDANFVFSAGGSVHGCVSFARLHERNGLAPSIDSLLVDRFAKIALSCSIKSLDVPSSLDPNCVTAYCHDLAECDRKPPTPSAATDRLYREAIMKYEKQNAFR